MLGRLWAAAVAYVVPLEQCRTCGYACDGPPEVHDAAVVTRCPACGAVVSVRSYNQP